MAYHSPVEGAGHPLQTQAERLYMVQAIRTVSQVFIRLRGWLPGC